MLVTTVGSRTVVNGGAVVVEIEVLVVVVDVILPTVGGEPVTEILATVKAMQSRSGHSAVGTFQMTLLRESRS